MRELQITVMDYLKMQFEVFRTSNPKPGISLREAKEAVDHMLEINEITVVNQLSKPGAKK
jgi:hypothetical protein